MVVGAVPSATELQLSVEQHSVTTLPTVPAVQLEPNDWTIEVVPEVVVVVVVFYVSISLYFFFIFGSLKKKRFTTQNELDEPVGIMVE